MSDDKKPNVLTPEPVSSNQPDSTIVSFEAPSLTPRPAPIADEHVKVSDGLRHTVALAAALRSQER